MKKPYKRPIPKVAACTVCSQDCPEYSVECTRCFRWTHFGCLPISEEVQNVWNTSEEFAFLCKNCIGYTDNGFSFDKSLRRLIAAKKDIRKLRVRAKNEALLLETYQVHLPSETTTVRKPEVDIPSFELLSRCNPLLLQSYTPQYVGKDGNCLFRSVSHALYGSEQYHVELRTRTALEIIQHPMWYDDRHPNYCAPFRTDNRVLRVDYNTYCKEILCNGNFSDLVEVLAVSAVVGEKISVYFPPLASTLEKSPFSGQIVGRGVDPTRRVKVQLMWTACQFDESTHLQDININHFVPLWKQPFTSTPNVDHIVISDACPQEISMTAAKSSTLNMENNATTPSPDLSGISVLDDSQNGATADQRPLKDPNLSLEDPNINLEDPNISLEVPDISPDDPNISLEDPNISLEDPNISPDDPNISLEDPNISLEDPNISPDDPNISLEDPNISLEDPNISPDDPNISPDDPHISLEDPNISLEDPNISLEDPNISPEDSNHSLRNETSDSDNFNDTLPNIEFSRNKSHGHPLPEGKFMDAATILQTLSNINDSKIVQDIPTGRKDNCYFVIHNENNASRRARGKKAIFIDDCGVWLSKSYGCPRTYFIKRGENFNFVEKRNGLFVRRINKEWVPLCPQPEEERVVCLVRCYSILKQFDTYRRRITWMDGSPHALVEYQGKHPKWMSSHGNRKYGSAQYVRTKAEVVEKIKDKVTAGISAKQVYTDLLLDDSDMAPRDTKQVHNVKQAEKRRTEPVDIRKPSRNLADHIQIVASMLQDHEYVQQMIHSKGKPPSIILYTTEQMTHLKTMVRNDNDCSVLGVDRTFNLGPCYVTVTVYKCKTVLKKDSRENPLLLGPVFLHWDGSFETYYSFFSHLKMKIQAANIEMKLDTLTLGSDEEKALTTAMKVCFPDADRLLCVRHLKKNVKSYLTKKVAVTEGDRKDLLRMIFGENGLVSSDDSVIFDTRATELASKVQTICPEAKKYIAERIQPLLVQHVTHPNKKLGAVSLWTNNNAESINHVLKMAVDWKPQQLPTLIEKMYQVVRVQFADLRRSLYDQGNYCLIPSLTTMRVAPAVWTQKTKEERNKLFQRLLLSKSRNPKIAISTDQKLTIPLTPNAGKKPGDRKRKGAARTFTIKKHCKH